MTQFKGTQGAWCITSDNLDENGAGYISIGSDYEKWLAEAKGTHVGPENIVECRANALLISKAPEMLEMLGNIVPILERVGEFGTYKDVLQLIKEATTI